MTKYCQFKVKVETYKLWSKVSWNEGYSCMLSRKDINWVRLKKQIKKVVCKSTPNVPKMCQNLGKLKIEIINAKFKENVTEIKTITG